MSVRRAGLGSWLLIILLVGSFGYRAVEGWIHGLALARASSLKNQGSRGRAQEQWRNGARGGDRLRGLREAGEATAGLWDRRFSNEGSALMNDSHLETAIGDYVSALQITPASGTNWSGLARIYDRKERLLRARRPGSEEQHDGDWDQVGRAGRIAIGLMRRATEAEPTWYVHRDNLAIMYLRYGLKDAALAEVRRSAEALPLYARHSYRLLSSFPDEMLQAFIEGSRNAVGKTPLLPQTDHLVSLARLERRSGQWDKSVATLNTALAGPLDRSDRAEVQYNLGLALIRLERLDEAEENLSAAAEHPWFRSMSLVSLSRIADERGDTAAAMEWLRQARRDRPQDLYLSLGFARMAAELEDWTAAFEALNWATLTHPREPRVHEQLFDTYLAADRWDDARKLLKKLETRGVEVNLRRMRRDLVRATPEDRLR